MQTQIDVLGVGNAIVDVIASCDDVFLSANGLEKGSMRLIDQGQGDALYAKMGQGRESSGGSAANTTAGVASFGAKARFVGKVADDQLGRVFAHDLSAIGVSFDTAPLLDGPSTARCLVNVTPDGERTMCTFLGAASRLSPADIVEADIAAAKIVFLEGYLFDPEDAKQAFAKAAGFARIHGRKVALTLSDRFCVENHRDGFQALIDNQLDIVFANESEIMSLAQTEDFATALSFARGLKPLMVITRGAQGSLAIRGDQTVEIAAEPVAKVVDTTGAGDLYAAGFLTGMARGLSLAQCGRLASIAAAEIISHYGARPEVSLAGLSAAVVA